MMVDIYNGWKLAWSYFTLIPIRFDKNTQFNSIVYRYMLLFFPLTGAFIALVATILYKYILVDLSWLGALIASSIYMMLYGFLHTEAICDVADAIYAKHSGKDAYEVIKEPTIGAMGLFWGVALFIIKLSTIVYLFLNSNPLLLIVVSLSSRLSLLILIKLYEFRSSFVDILKESLTLSPLIVAIFLYSIALLLIFKVSYLIALLIAITTSILSSYIIKNNLGFINGDILGVSLELSEIISIIGVLLWL